MFTFLTSFATFLIVAAAFWPQDPACGVTEFNDRYGLIKTPNYPNKYPDNMYCAYYITGNDSYPFTATYYTCDCKIQDRAPGSNYCDDNIMFGGNAPEQCGDIGDTTFSENSYSGTHSFVSVRFYSDANVTDVGCQIVYGINATRSELISRCPQ